MATTPAREFGKRRPAAIPAPEPVKRSGHVALLLMGTFAVGGIAYALMPGEKNCGQRPGLASDQQAGTPCAARGSSSGGGSGSWRRNFFGSDATGSQPAASSDPAPGSVKRGGFGGFAQAFASHFSRGG
jgi:hypothetical protein